MVFFDTSKADVLLPVRSIDVGFGAAAAIKKLKTTDENKKTVIQIELSEIID